MGPLGTCIVDAESLFGDVYETSRRILKNIPF